MATLLTDAQRAFIRDNRFYGIVTTLRSDGSPHSTVVWVDERDGKVLFNTAYPRAKTRDLEGDPRASVVVLDPSDGYRWLAVSGPVELSTDGADDDIHALSRKYDGKEYTSFRDGETRVTALVTPERVDVRGI
jgi:PPOX class probable F420-dependent enzyme